MALLQIQPARAQTDVVITPPDTAYSIAVSALCVKDTDGPTASLAFSSAQIVADDLTISGLYRVQGPAKDAKPLGSCRDANGGPYSDAIRGMDIHAVVGGKLRAAGEGKIFVFDFYLLDLKTGKNIIGKRYQAERGQEDEPPHRFANEILAALTGEKGMFGREIAFSSGAGNGKRELYAIYLGGKTRRQLTNDGAIAATPAYSPDGSKIVYASTDLRTKTSDLQLIPATGGRPKKVTRLAGSENSPAFSADGKNLLAAAEISGKSSVVLFNLRGRMLQKFTEPGNEDRSPSWSPDDRQIAFASNRGGQYQIYTMRADGGRAKLLAAKPGMDCSQPRWSPDGGKIAYVCGRPGARQLFLTDLNGGDSSQLTFKGDSFDPCWSPNGRMLAYANSPAGNSAANLAVFSIETLRSTPITPPGSGDADPVWSPVDRLK